MRRILPSQTRMIGLTGIDQLAVKARKRSRNYIRDINPLMMRSIWPNKEVRYRVDISQFPIRYMFKVELVLLKIEQFSCLRFVVVPPGATLPQKQAGNVLVEPVVVFTRVTTEGECFSVIHNGQIKVMIHETICGSSIDIMAVTLGVLGIIVPKNSNLRLWDLMPLNMRDFEDMRENCNMENALTADPPPVDWMTPSAMRTLNEMFCSDSCHSKPQCHHGGVFNPKKCGQCICPQGFSGPLCDQLARSNGGTSSWCKSTTQSVTNEAQGITFGTIDFGRQSYVPPQDCTWLFTAPPGRKIKFQFVGDQFGYNCTQECICQDYLEIRDTEDLTVKSYRFCCGLRPKLRTIVSHSNKMLIVSRIHLKGSRGFQATVSLAQDNVRSGYS